MTKKKRMMTEKYAYWTEKIVAKHLVKESKECLRLKGLLQEKNGCQNKWKWLSVKGFFCPFYYMKMRLSYIKKSLDAVRMEYLIFKHCKIGN